jgi:hypothetical protein
MATDPFADIKRPTVGGSVEIGQPTFVELISAKRCVTSPAIGNATPDVRASLRRLAYGKKCVDRLRSPDPEVGVFSAVAAPGESQEAGFSYDLRTIDKGVSLYKQKVRNLGIAKESIEFRDIVKNSSAEASALVGCLKCTDQCVAGEDDVCAVDLCICLDTSGSMANQIDQVKTGIDEVAEFLGSTIGNNYRFALLAFADDVYQELVFSARCGTSSLEALKTALSPIGPCWKLDCGNLDPEFSAKAVYLAATSGFAGCWREGAVQALVLITDNVNDEQYSGISVDLAANSAAACGIKVAYAGSPGSAEEGDIYASVTGGVNVRLSSDGGGLKNLLQTFIYSLCARFIPSPECEGGTNIVLNGTFDEDINGWDTTGTVVWDMNYESSPPADPIYRSMRLNKGATASQTYTGLNPGDYILLNYNWCLRTDGESVAFGDYYYYVGISSIWRSKTDGSDLESFTETGLATSITYDSTRGKIYWSERSNQTGAVTNRSGIYSIRIDGTDLTTLYEYNDVFDHDATTIRGLVYDSVTDKIYYSFNDSVSGVACIKSMQAAGETVDGSGHVTLANTVTNGEAVQLAIDETNRKLYWTANRIPDNTPAVIFSAGEDPADTSWVYSMDMDGSNLQIINKDFIGLRDIEVHVDTVYVVAKSAVGWGLYSMGLDGSNVAQVSVPPTDDPDISGFGDMSGLYYDGDQFVVTSPALGFAMRFRVGDAEGQIMAGPELQYFTDVIKVSGSGTADATQTIIGELRDSSGNPLEVAEGSGETSHSAIAGDCSTDRQLRPPIRVRVPFDGIIKIHFELVGSASPNTHWLNIDQIVVCTLASADCGPGARNLIRNGDFQTGVQEWTDENGNALAETDPSIWDDNVFAIVVNITSESEVRQRITDLTPGRELTLSFEITSYEPDIISELELVYGILNDSGSLIAEEKITNATLQPTPKRLSLDFVVPSDGIIEVFFKTGAVGGTAKIRNVLLCDFSGVCEDGYERVSYDEFDINKGSWSGGVYNALDKQVEITPDEPQLRQVFTDLTPGSTFQLSVNVKSSGGVVINLFSDTSGVGGGEIGQLITSTAPGYYTVEVIVQGTGIVVAYISLQTPTDTIAVDDILACVSLPQPCDGSVSNMQAIIEWNGIARQPVNLFNVIVRYIIRDWDDPFTITEETYLPTSEGRISILVCDLWKSQTASGNALRSSLSNIGNIDNGDFASVESKADWLWSIPKNQISGAQDNLVVNFPDPGPGKLIESVQIFFLANSMVPIAGTETSPVYPPPLGCDPDPATEFNVTIRYVNSLGLNREFSAPFSKSDIWTQEADFGAGNPWDTDSATGNGIKGSSARWELVQFNLDAVDNSGLDQCTNPLYYRGTATGEFTFKRFSLKGSGMFIDPCDSEVIIEDTSSSESVNEIQSIALPNPTGGTWELSWTRSGITETIELQWDVTATELRDSLATISTIGSIDNIQVTGQGTAEDPFLIEFVNNLAATHQRMLVADGSGLIGTSSAFVTTVTDGTSNERQTISNPIDNPADLIITFAGATSIPIAYGSSLNDVEAALEGISTIGTNNVAVTGKTTDRDATYYGPYYVDFIGDLGNQNVVEMIPEPSSYKVVTDWNGGPGAGKNETQLLNITAWAGAFRVRVYNEDATASVETSLISYVASATAVKSTIVSSVPFIDADDIDVTLEKSDRTTGESIWQVVFKGAYANVDMPQMKINPENLLGALIDVREVQVGSGSEDRQRVTVLRAFSGSWNLTVTIDGEDYTTTAIPWNTTPDGLQAQLTALPPFEEGDITVINLPKTSAEQNLRVEIAIHRKFGNVPLMVPDFQETLLCDPIVLPPVAPPPPLPIPNCDDLPSEDLRCSSGPLLCRPGPGDDPIEPEICCNKDTIPNSVNVSTRIKFERDLFEPNGSQRTIRDLALLKGMSPAQYSPYIRSNGRLTETSWDLTVTTKMSVLLIENELDDANGRSRIMNHIAGHREILPSRFVWPDCDVTTSVPANACWPGS